MDPEAGPKRVLHPTSPISQPHHPVPSPHLWRLSAAPSSHKIWASTLTVWHRRSGHERDMMLWYTAAFSSWVLGPRSRLGSSVGKLMVIDGALTPERISRDSRWHATVGGEWVAAPELTILAGAAGEESLRDAERYYGGKRPPSSASGTTRGSKPAAARKRRSSKGAGRRSAGTGKGSTRDEL
jgi:hypothetical protein